MIGRPRLATAAVWSLLLCGMAQALEVGERAPDFTRADMSGRQVTLSGYRGKLLLLNFWATWCAPCREELPAFTRWQKSYGSDGLQVIGVSMDDESESVRQLLARHPVSYPVVMGDARLGERFGGVLGLPLTLLIDAQGRVVARFQGAANLPAMEAKLRQLLARQHH